MYYPQQKHLAILLMSQLFYNISYSSTSSDYMLTPLLDLNNLFQGTSLPMLEIHQYLLQIHSVDNCHPNISQEVFGFKVTFLQ